jgi:putative oxygen-independent coproporphyrinogen III oxidase
MPWCVRKCPYCDFNSHRAPEILPQREYIAVLLEDLEIDLPYAADRQLISIFFGGGTPSLFSPDQIARFLQGVSDRIDIAADAEITLEANPGTIERGRFAGYREAGVNRVSLGVQSLNDDHLRALGRIHSVGDVERAVEELRDAGIENFNVDLMYGLPDQTADQAISDLNRAIEYQPAHISHYQLTLEPGTAFHRRPPPLPDADLLWDMQVASQERLCAAGYRQYEVSAYAREGQRCVHNMNYWQFGDYLGIGAGAHGKITLPDLEIVRTTRIRSPLRYLSTASRDRVESRTAVPLEQRPFEFMLNALRLTDGTDLSLFHQRTGLGAEIVAQEIERAQREGLLQVADADRWIPTEFGRRFLNDLQQRFLPSTAGANAPKNTSLRDVTERASS